MRTGTPALGEGHPVSLEMNHFCWGNCLGTFHSLSTCNLGFGHPSSLSAFQPVQGPHRGLWLYRLKDDSGEVPLRPRLSNLDGPHRNNIRKAPRHGSQSLVLPCHLNGPELHSGQGLPHLPPITPCPDPHHKPLPNDIPI